MAGRVLVIGLLTLALPGPLAAQQAEDAVVAVVRGLFDAMRAKDTVALRATLHPSARLLRAGPDREGTLGVQAVPLDRFVQGIGAAQADLDEKIWDPEVRIDGDLATVWTPYAFYVNGTLSHCGVDAFQLARTEAGWKIIQIADTQRRQGCATPPAHAR